MLHETDAEFVVHEPCPECNSSDALARYDDGHGYCFSCTTYFHGDGEAQPVKERPRMSKPLAEIENEQVQQLRKRGLSEETCEKWGYTTGTYKGKPVQVANYRDPQSRQLVAQKIRFPNKDFVFMGDTKAAGLFGQHLWRDGGKRVVVTEGEIDAMSVSQMQGNKWPVVSVPNGAQGATKAVRNALDWLESFETVVFLFDMDEPGRAAATACALLLSPGKARIATLPLKDANDMLVSGKGGDLIQATWDARPYRPDGIVTFGELHDKLQFKPEMGLSYPWPELTRHTFGIRLNELVALGAGTGIGKSDVFKEIATHLLVEHGEKVGMIMLEEACTHTAKCIMSKQAGKLFHIPGEDWTDEEFAAAEAMIPKDRLILYDHFGATDYDIIKSRIRYMAVSLGCKYIFLDHITALVSGDASTDERRELDAIMTGLASLVRELNINIHFISHLASPLNTPHEEGGRVTIKQFRGSRAIGQWSSFMFGLERDQQDIGSPTTFRILKDRYTGRATGRTFYLGYDPKTGRMFETDAALAADGEQTHEDF